MNNIAQTIVPTHANPFGDLIAVVTRYTGLPEWLTYPVGFLVASGVLLGVVSLIVMILIYGERKIAGHMQSRLGPMLVGWHGVLQSLADGIKLLAKEDLIPGQANRFLFSLAPALVFIGAFAPFAAVPLARPIVTANMDIGLYYVLGLASVEVVGLIMAGWASNSKWSLFGGMRLAAMMISYEIPLGLSVLTVVVLAGTLNLNEMAAQQAFLPFALKSPFCFLGFICFYVSALANTKRAPFDLPEAESELVSGFHTEYSGMRFAFFFLSEYAAMTIMSALGSVVFLGGWNFPFPAANSPVIGALQMATKTSVLLFVMIWLRWTLPRVRIDQTMSLCLKFLLPVGVFCLMGSALQLVAGFAPLWWLVVAGLVWWSFRVARPAMAARPRALPTG